MNAHHTPPTPFAQFLAALLATCTLSTAAEAQTKPDPTLIQRENAKPGATEFGKGAPQPSPHPAKVHPTPDLGQDVGVGQNVELSS